MQIRSALKNIRNKAYWEIERIKLLIKYINKPERLKIELHIQKYEQMMFDSKSANAIPQYYILKGYVEGMRTVLDGNFDDYKGHLI